MVGGYPVQSSEADKGVKGCEEFDSWQTCFFLFNPPNPQRKQQNFCRAQWQGQ
jgi:hypothetical protein